MTERLRLLTANRWFSLADLLLVVVSGAAWTLIPKYGIGFTLFALLPWVLRLLGGGLPFHRTPFDGLIAIFLITAGIGYWAAYDKPAAWIKIWLIVTTVLLYYALSAQPRRNLEYLSALCFCLAVGLSINILLTFDLAGGRTGIASWWMSNRPQVNWPTIPHGSAAGLLILTSLFAFYWLWSIRNRSLGHFTVAMRVLVILGLGVILWAFQLTLARGLWAIATGAVGIAVMWRVRNWAMSKGTARARSAFPVLVLVCLAAVIILAYLGPARVAYDTTSNSYGDNSRAGLLARAAYFVEDYPITGGGLASFPGLYSEYMLAIPHFYFQNSYNLFLDVAIEQGLVGGLAFLSICLGSIWLVSRTNVGTRSPQIDLFGWLSLCALAFTIVHGLFYDYLFSGNGTLLLLFPIGISMAGAEKLHNSADKTMQLRSITTLWRNTHARMIITAGALGIVTIMILNTNKIISIWFANLGAVQMSQVELKDFPTNQWAKSQIVPDLVGAQDSLRYAVKYDASNESANYRLGLISMLQQDFGVASAYLESAQAEAPNHRGINKSLGYCYVWLGNPERAQLLLAKIPEARQELDAYVWWWTMEGRPDLAAKAYQMAFKLESSR